MLKKTKQKTHLVAVFGKLNDFNTKCHFLCFYHSLFATVISKMESTVIHPPPHGVVVAMQWTMMVTFEYSMDNCKMAMMSLKEYGSFNDTVNFSCLPATKMATQKRSIF